MIKNIKFRKYKSEDKKNCLAIFDANCPDFFAPNERYDFEKFLDQNPANYELCLINDKIVGAFGLMGEGPIRRSLKWILLFPQYQRDGLGSIMVNRLIELAHQMGLGILDVAASQISAPFFARFGAVMVGRTENGWGPDMHRLDMEIYL